MNMSEKFLLDKTHFPLNRDVLVTCALPYSNGPFHIAHLRTYIPGDTFARFLKKIGQDTIFVCGSDEHGTPILLNAEKKGIEPGQLSRKYHEKFKKVLYRLSVNFDYYGQTDSKTNHKQAQSMVQAMIDNGYVYTKKLSQFYCTNCKKYLPDRFLRGVCAFCGAQARGDECDVGCGKHLSPDDILDPKCEICGDTPKLKTTEHYFFKLSQFSDFLKKYIPNTKSTKNAKNYALNWIKDGLNDWCISRNLKWGVKFPNSENLIMYVWVDAPNGYISFTKELTDQWEYYWKKDGGIIHFIGPDIIYHHCIFWPAMLKAANYNLPYAVVASGSVKIEGKPFSKTRGYAVWLEEDYLDKGFDPDVLRYYITSFTGQTKDLDFSWKIYQEKLNNELVAILGNFVYRSLHFTNKHFGEIPNFKYDKKIKEKIIETVGTYWNFFDRYEFKGAIDSVLTLAKFSNEYFQRNKPWKLIKEDKEKCKDVLGNSLWLTKALAILIEPFMPKKAQNIWESLSQKDDISNVKIDQVLNLEEGSKLKKPKLLFKKIEDKVIDKIEDEFFKRIQKVDQKPQKEEIEMIDFSDFQKINLLVGEIKKVENVKGADKLLKINIDLGDREKQVVAGLAQHYSQDDLIGKKVVLLDNLKPAKLKGVESQGMLLAAEDKTKVSLLTVDLDVANGSKVL